MEIDDLRVTIAEKKSRAFDQCRMFLDGDINPEHAGYKTIEDAVCTIIRRNV